MIATFNLIDTFWDIKHDKWIIKHNNYECSTHVSLQCHILNISTLFWKIFEIYQKDNSTRLYVFNILFYLTIAICSSCTGISELGEKINFI